MVTYKAIGFDYGGVIAGKTGVTFGREVAKELGISFEEYKRVYFDNNKKINVEGFSWPEFWKFFVNEIGKPEKLENILKISDEYGKLLHVINQNMLDLVDKIKLSGFKVGLLSNNTQENADMLRSRGVDTHFDVFHISAETGLQKPNPLAFAKFIDELGIKPKEFIFIDDSEKSLSTSDECGFTPIIFESYEQLCTSLAKLGVL